MLVHKLLIKLVCIYCLAKVDILWLYLRQSHQTPSSVFARGGLWLTQKLNFSLFVCFDNVTHYSLGFFLINLFYQALESKITLLARDQLVHETPVFRFTIVSSEIMDELIFKSKIWVLFVAHWWVDLGPAMTFRLVKRLKCLCSWVDIDSGPFEVLVCSFIIILRRIFLKFDNEFCFHSLSIFIRVKTVCISWFAPLFFMSCLFHIDYGVKFPFFLRELIPFPGSHSLFRS